MAQQISLLTHHLGGEAHVLRCAIVNAIGQLLSKVFRDRPSGDELSKLLLAALLVRACACAEYNGGYTVECTIAPMSTIAAVLFHVCWLSSHSRHAVLTYFAHAVQARRRSACGC